MDNNARSYNDIQSRRHGGSFGGFSHPNKAPSPLRLKYERLNQSSFCQLLECQAPLHKRKAPLLKTIWRRFWRYSQAYVGFDRVNHIKLMFITTESHHVGETFMFDPLLFPWSCSGCHTFLILESPLLRNRSHTHENHELWRWSHVHEKRALEPKLFHFYDGSAALRLKQANWKYLALELLPPINVLGCKVVEVVSVHQFWKMKYLSLQCQQCLDSLSPSLQWRR